MGRLREKLGLLPAPGPRLRAARAPPQRARSAKGSRNDGRSRSSKRTHKEVNFQKEVPCVTKHKHFAHESWQWLRRPVAKRLAATLTVWKDGQTGITTFKNVS